MSEQTEISKEITFWDLLKSNEIIIPKIQRDFAQGRDDKKIVIIRKSILDKFKTVLTSENEKLSLDFVYGSNENNQIIPLDGQQRLTTLFLLHLYLAKISGNCDEENKKIFKNFQYEIRSSSQKFINALIENELDDDIENQSWFFNSWKKDPTVKGMLVMFSAISEQFKNEVGMWVKLINNEKITFYFLPLDKFKLTDQLYVKMNSRGKSLSDFENFKSWLDEKLISTQNFDKDKWSLKLDTVWTDLFWEIDGGDFSIDDELMAFFRGVALFNYVEQFNEENSDKNAKDSRLKEFQKNITDLNNNKIYISNSEFETYLLDSNGTIFNDIFCFLDFYAVTKNREKILKLLNEISFFGGVSDLFKRFIHATDFSNKVLFYGLFKYVNIHKGIEEVHFKDCFRILRNLVENSTITAENFKNILKSTEELVHCKNLLNELKNLNLTGFDGEQIKEEKLKAELILKGKVENENWKDVIIQIENHLLLKGKIGFLLDSSIDLMTLEKRTLVIINLFNKNGVVLGKNSNLLGRVILALGLDLVNNYEIWLGGKVNQYWKEHLKNSKTNTYIRQAIDLLLDKNVDEYEVIWRNVLTEGNFPFWKRTLLNNPSLFSSYSCYGRVKKDWRGINIYEQQKFNSNANAILIENNRNEVINFFEDKGFMLNHTVRICKKFYTGDTIILSNENINMVFQRLFLEVKENDTVLLEKFHFNEDVGDKLNNSLNDYIKKIGLK
jgi:hypothetical protein